MLIKGGFAPPPLLLFKGGDALHPLLSYHPRVGGFWVLGFTDPVLCTVCSDLPASSCSAIDPTVAARFHFLATVVFRYVLRTSKKSYIFCSKIGSSCLKVFLVVMKNDMDV